MRSALRWLWQLVRGKVRRCWCCDRWRDTEASCTWCGDHPLACECWACDIEVDDDGNLVPPTRASDGPSLQELHGWMMTETFARTLRRSSLHVPEQGATDEA